MDSILNFLNAGVTLPFWAVAIGSLCTASMVAGLVIVCAFARCGHSIDRELSD